MMRIALAVFLLLASAAPAFAECAWVLWSSTATGMAVVEAFSDRAACEREVSKRYDSMVRDDTRLLVVLRCFPDTVDPRAPRGR